MVAIFGNAAVSGFDDLSRSAAIECFRRGDYADALRRANAILMDDSMVALSWRFKGECLVALDRLQEAVECYRRAIQIGGRGTEDLFMWIARCLANEGRVQEARATIERFLGSEAGAHSELRVQAHQALAMLVA